MAFKRCGQLKHLFNSPDLGPWLKVRLYSAAVCSLLTYGCEAWTLTEKVLRKINGANSQMLASFTGQNIHQEAKPATCNHNITLHIRRMRLKWLHDILLMDDTRLVHIAMRVQQLSCPKGGILMDSPPHSSIDDLIIAAHDNAYWNEHKRSLHWVFIYLLTIYLNFGTD